jgi:hypothetical protein
MVTVTLPQSRCIALWLRTLERIGTHRQLCRDVQRPRYRHIPQRLWNRHSALLLAAEAR